MSKNINGGIRQNIAEPAAAIHFESFQFVCDIFLMLDLKATTNSNMNGTEPKSPDLTPIINKVL